MAQYIQDYYLSWVDARMDNPASLQRVQDFYADEVMIITHPKIDYAHDDFEQTPYYSNPQCGMTGVTCKPDVWDHLVKPFVTNCPGLLHDTKMSNFKPLGDGKWEAWIFYEFEATCQTGIANFPGVTIYTVDMNQTRADGKKGRNIRVRNIFDNYRSVFGHLPTKGDCFLCDDGKAEH